MTEGHTPTQIRTLAPAWQTFHGHVTQECEFRRDGGPACPACLAARLPAALPEHRWPWVPRVGPGAVLAPVPERHDDDDVVRWGGTAQVGEHVALGAEQ